MEAVVAKALSSNANSSKGRWSSFLGIQIAWTTKKEMEIIILGLEDSLLGH